MRRCALAFCESWCPWRPFADEVMGSSRMGVTSAGITSEGGHEDEPVEENAEDEEGCSVPPAVKGDDDRWRWKLRGVLQGRFAVALLQVKYDYDEYPLTIAFYVIGPNEASGPQSAGPEARRPSRRRGPAYRVRKICIPAESCTYGYCR